MKYTDVISKVNERLRVNGVRKDVQFPASTFHICDEDGNSKDFKVRKSDKKVMFRKEDVQIILDTIIDIIKESIAQGDAVSIKGFGTLGLKYVAPKTYYDFGGTEAKLSKPHYAIKFSPGKDLDRAAVQYTLLSLQATEEERKAIQDGTILKSVSTSEIVDDEEEE